MQHATLQLGILLARTTTFRSHVDMVVLDVIQMLFVASIFSITVICKCDFDGSFCRLLCATYPNQLFAFVTSLMSSNAVHMRVC